MTVYSPDDRSTNRNVPSGPVVSVSTTLPAASSRVDPGLLHGPPATGPHRPPQHRATRQLHVLAGLPGGHHGHRERGGAGTQGALAARVYSPATSSVMT